LGSTPDAEDVAHETLVRLWQSELDFGAGGDARTVMAWLYRTCTRLAIDVLRRRRRTTDADDDGLVEERLPCAMRLEEAVVAKSVILTLHARVPNEELEAAILCRVDGLSHVEAGEVLGVSERTVRRLLERFDVHAEASRKEFSA
jgi:RNA polymerase sigma-70 factor (ECF subfamily)